MALTIPKTIAELKTELELGTTADLDTGVTAGDVLKLDGSGNLPAANARLVTEISNDVTNTPMFQAYASANKSVSDAAWIDFDSDGIGLVEEFDSDNTFDITTGRFTPVKLGHYYIAARAHGDCGGGQLQGAYVRVLKNGSLVHQAEIQEQSADANEHTVLATCIVEVDDAADYITAQLYYNDESGDPTIYGGGDASSGYRARNTIFLGYRLAV